MSSKPSVESPQPRGSRKRRLERIAMGIMALGALMMFQPFMIILFTYSFITFLAGTIMFVVVSHFSD
jgi:hypothetical protein